MRAFLPLVALSSLAQVTQALYFFLDGATQKCFYEELPKDTLVVGHYTAEEYDENRHAWWKHDGISILITVDVRRSQYKAPPQDAGGLKDPHTDLAQTGTL